MTEKKKRFLSLSVKPLFVLLLGLVLLGVMVAVGFRAVLWKLVLVLVIQKISELFALIKQLFSF